MPAVSLESLAVETIGEILSHLIESSFWDCMEDSLHKDDTETILRSSRAVAQARQTITAPVSRRYRQAALLQSDLWRHIVFTVSPKQDLFDTILRIHHENQSRAGTLGLRIICNLEDASTAVQQCASAVLSSLLPKTSSLILVLPLLDNHSYPSFSLNFEPFATKRLVQMAVVHRGSPWHTPNPWAEKCIPTIPNLRWYRGNAYSTRGNRNLRYLHLGNIMLTHLMRMISGSPVLESIHVRTVYTNDAAIPPHLIHHKLSIVHIGSLDTEFFTHVTLPALRVLDCTLKYPDHIQAGKSWPEGPEYSNAVDFIQRSNCKLTSLSVGYNLFGPSLVDILKNQNELESLELRTPERWLIEMGQDARVDPLAIKYLSAPNVPKLRDLSIVMDCKNATSLKEALESRLHVETVAKLDTLEVMVTGLQGKYSRPEMSDLEKVFGEYEDMGVLVYVQNYGRRQTQCGDMGENQFVEEFF
ncbi:hypothetical protein CYLTODRAFT_490304 [Cylindrobasidium torrendii FP15055 ss-10]|uniref:F-box domain-containing protein n=1 Tax=Cylindrobasidium torrendii FP15055 ss-10 TaxID=1314674 RepID=A0A0D7BCC9_9AGAR|nr:hypothetical protein CYLTODRAFT_490304 [Cylindrobasidium torrendii FP15055 ss-10]